MKRVSLALLVLLVATPVLAQSRTGSTRPAQDRIGLIAFGTMDSLSIASSQSFDAVFGTSRTTALGAGVDVVNVWRHLFVRVASSKASLDGQRVVVVNSTVYPLGTKLTMDMAPTEIGVGWRLTSSNPGMRLTPYGGASLVLLNYKETSTFGDTADNVDQTFKGLGVFGGVDARVTQQVLLGVEAQYRTVNSDPASNSAAASFNEKNLGGLVLRARLGFRF